ncbi:MAG: hypothetical protein JW751_22780 [Polyangiaceae bacterium]|nr:hypothetical protein [Polyangiaceae bacterium]
MTLRIIATTPEYGQTYSFIGLSVATAPIAVKVTVSQSQGTSAYHPEDTPDRLLLFVSATTYAELRTWVDQAGMSDPDNPHRFEYSDTPLPDDGYPLLHYWHCGGMVCTSGRCPCSFNGDGPDRER